nr:hypothetical protein [Methylococcus sp. EFPC2]
MRFASSPRPAALHVVYQMDRLGDRGRRYLADAALTANRCMLSNQFDYEIQSQSHLGLLRYFDMAERISKRMNLAGSIDQDIPGVESNVVQIGMAVDFFGRIYERQFVVVYIFDYRGPGNHGFLPMKTKDCRMG